MARYSKKAQAAIGRKMHAMRGEGRSQKQKVAIAISSARARGLKVPRRKK